MKLQTFSSYEILMHYLDNLRQNSLKIRDIIPKKI